MEVTVKWLENRCFVGQTGSGHAVVMDGAPSNGGTNLGARPMEMVLLGLGGCASFDVVMILERARQQITECQIQITSERSSEDPKVFTKIEMTFIVTGKNLAENQVARAVELSATKYCSVAKMLDKTAAISHKIEIIEA